MSPELGMGRVGGYSALYQTGTSLIDLGVGLSDVYLQALRFEATVCRPFLGSQDTLSPYLVLLGILRTVSCHLFWIVSKIRISFSCEGK